MRATIAIDLVGLSPAMVGPHTPNLARLAASGGMRAVSPVTPAVTCTVQSTYLTGLAPRDHGIVGNGWYFRDLNEVLFWRQSNRLVYGERIWETARKRDPSFTCANLFWWYAMASSVDIAVTPRPMYPADGRKLPDCYSAPPEIRGELNAKLGMFPLFRFWGPLADISSSQWIVRAALHVMDTRKPTLTLVYLPHLDYNLQRLGPEDARIAEDLRAVDAACGELLAYAERTAAACVVLSEYTIEAVDTPVHLNRVLRDAGLITVREELGRELLDPGASQAFAVADHQVAHVYVREPARIAQVKALLERVPGVAQVLDAAGKAALGLDHARAGELVAIARPGAWFTYYYWLDDARAPDFARTVDIHRKPGYDPVELFLDPAIRIPQLALGWRLAKKALGLRTLMDVIGLDPSLVRGSHGRAAQDPRHGPVLISSERALLPDGDVSALAVKDLLLAHVFGAAAGARA